MEWTRIKTEKDLPAPGLRVIATDGTFTGEAYITAVCGVNTWHRGYHEPWEAYARKPVIAWAEMPNRNSETESHSERDIYDGCVELMQMLMGRFERYLDFIGVPVTPKEDKDNEEYFSTQFYVTEIVERLFLWNTSHSGGTSTRMKCKELGISDETVIFEDEREVSDEETD